ncbi:hypothetical protein [Hyphomonas oceanitis]|uniref:hypothetical protein n=1 Tax=Hyphomonas oceanitis TaxID=81033 RepID=UPI0030015680|tara:strand:+ start:2377 stop:3006 length:630 start_codon:yes stop_codon:yes gene_type:complete
MKSGGSELRDRALGRYARGAVGGSSVGVRRYGAVAGSGSVAIGVLSELGSGGTGETTSGKDLSAAIGAPVETAAQIIAEAVAPDTSEGDSIRILIEEAICEVLQGEETLERESITPEFLDAVLFQYTVEAIMHDMLAREGSPSLDAAESAEILQARENELRQAVEAVVDSRLVANKAGRELGAMSQAERRQLQLDCIQSVLEVWESYDE